MSASFMTDHRLAPSSTSRPIASTFAGPCTVRYRRCQCCLLQAPCGHFLPCLASLHLHMREGTTHKWGATDPSCCCLYALARLCETITSQTRLHLPGMQLVQARRTEYVEQDMSTCLHVCQGQWRPAFGADSLQFSAQLKQAGDDLTLTGICRQVQRGVASPVVLGSVCSPLLDELLHCCCSAMQGCIMQGGASCKTISTLTCNVMALHDDSGYANVCIDTTVSASCVYATWEPA